MLSNHKMGRFLVGPLMTGILLPVKAHATGWAVGTAGGYAEKFRSRTFRFFERASEDHLDGTGFPLVSILSNPNGRIGMTAQIAFLPYGNKYSRTDQVPVGVGARYRFTPGPQYEASPYVELSPALVWSNWRGGDYFEGGGSSVRPGLIAGLGVQGKVMGRIGLDFGARYFLSADAKTIERGTPEVSQTLKGLRQTGIVFGLNYRL